MSMWTTSVYTVHATMFPRGSACVYIVHMVFVTILLKLDAVVSNSEFTVCNVR